MGGDCPDTANKVLLGDGLLDRNPDLWVIRLDGKDMRLLVGNGASPSWGIERSNYETSIEGRRDKEIRHYCESSSRYLLAC